MGEMLVHLQSFLGRWCDVQIHLRSSGSADRIDKSWAIRPSAMGESVSAPRTDSFSVSRCLVSQLVCSGLSQRYSTAVQITIALNLVKQRLTAALSKHRMFAVLLWALRVHSVSAVASA